VPRSDLVASDPRSATSVIYHPGMGRPVLVLWMALTAALTSVAAAPVARADPPPRCSFALSPPRWFRSRYRHGHRDGGTDRCGMPASPYLSVACLQGGGGHSMHAGPRFGYCTGFCALSPRRNLYLDRPGPRLLLGRTVTPRPRLAAARSLRRDPLALATL